jgi:integrase
MAKVRKRTWTSGKGEQTAWVADYFDQAGKRHIKTFTTKKAATAWLVGTQHEVKEGIHTPESSSITVAEAAALWLERGELEGLERATLRGYRQHINLHIVPSRIGSEKLARLTTPAIVAFRDALLRKSSRSLAGKVLTSLKSILKEAQKRGLAAHNPAAPVQITARKRDMARVTIPSKAEIQAILAHAQSHWRAFLVTAVFTGMRASELRGLAWNAVDLERRVIHVRQRADRWSVIGAPKSDASKREIPLSPMVVNALKEWRLACPSQKFVFVNGRGNIRRHAEVADNFYTLQRAIGLVDEQGKPKYGFHALRHFCASAWIEAGFSPKRLQVLLGHSSITMTFDTYGHLFPSLEDDHDRLAAVELSVVAQPRSA